jgi:hypothetical protein
MGNLRPHEATLPHALVPQAQRSDRPDERPLDSDA